MNTDNRNILFIGILLLISGTIAIVTSYEPSSILKYVFALTSFAAGILGILVGRNKKGGFVRSTYYWWIGLVSIGLSISIGIWANSLPTFINVTGFFLLILGVVEFVFALQILNYETPIPWKLFGVKITLSALTATGAAWILTMAGSNIYRAFLFLGVLLVLSGLSFIQISRLTKNADLIGQ